MADDTFWSDTMTIYLSDDLESSISGPKSILDVISPVLISKGCKIIRTDKKIEGTERLHTHFEMFIESDADKSIVDLVESTLTNKGVTYQKHTVVNDENYIDLNYDLNNFSVWK